MNTFVQNPVCGFFFFFFFLKFFEIAACLLVYSVWANYISDECFHIPHGWLNFYFIVQNLIKWKDNTICVWIHFLCEKLFVLILRWWQNDVSFGASFWEKEKEWEREREKRFALCSFQYKLIFHIRLVLLLVMDSKERKIWSNHVAFCF